jgi:two-component system sensor histidine kinase MprB
MKLRTRMALIAAAAVAVVVVIAGFLAQAVARQELLREIDESLLARAAEIERSPLIALNLLADSDDAIDNDDDARRNAERGRFRSFGPDALLGRGTTGFDALFVQVLGPSGQVVAPLGQPVSLPVADGDAAYAGRISGAPVLRTVEIAEDRIRMVSAPIGDGVVIQIGRSLQEVDETLSGVTGRLTLAGAIGVAIAGVFGLVVAQSALRPVDALTETVEHVTETRELGARIEVERDDEIGRLARSFNAMLEALQDSQVQQQQLVRDAGHELRTPLTALRTNIEVLARARGLTDEQRTELLDAATYELHELTDLTAELVELAADPDAASDPAELVRLDELVERVIELYRRRTGREINLDAQPFTADLSVSAIERAVANLIDNADKWSPPDGTIDVTVAGGRVAVRDHGVGVAAGDEGRIFDRFYRSDEARTTPGSGLGLAIVKKTVREHGGEVFVEQPHGDGVVVGFVLPSPPGAG